MTQQSTQFMQTHAYLGAFSIFQVETSFLLKEHLFQAFV